MGFDQGQDSHEYINGSIASQPPKKTEHMPESQLFSSALCLFEPEYLFVMPTYRRYAMMESSVMSLVVHS
jgi:hypothetical protein